VPQQVLLAPSDTARSCFAGGRAEPAAVGLLLPRYGVRAAFAVCWRIGRAGARSPTLHGN
jgi:hypothetical protein